jgi:hypothetical protein
MVLKNLRQFLPLSSQERVAMTFGVHNDYLDPAQVKKKMPCYFVTVVFLLVPTSIVSLSLVLLDY